MAPRAAYLGLALLAAAGCVPVADHGVLTLVVDDPGGAAAGATAAWIVARADRCEGWAAVDVFGGATPDPGPLWLGVVLLDGSEVSLDAIEDGDVPIGRAAIAWAFTDTAIGLVDERGGRRTGVVEVALGAPSDLPGWLDSGPTRCVQLELDGGQAPRPATGLGAVTEDGAPYRVGG